MTTSPRRGPAARLLGPWPLLGQRAHQRANRPADERAKLRRPSRSGATLLLVLMGLVAPVGLDAQTGDAGRIAAAVDSIVADALREGRAAGLSVAVVRGGDTVVLKGYGHADLELDVPTPDGAVYEIGSVTKQFTAAAILQLAERGRLGLDDDLTDHLPDYPTRGHRVPLRRLLDHTSGIRGYTEMPVFGELMTLALPRDSLVTLFSAEPFDFEPGAAMVYNNSAYFLLGLVIEAASGMSYAEYVERHLFEPAGMADSRYCDQRAVVKRRAHGYDMGPDGLLRAAYLDHTWPYAAGSLCSTVGDLVAWNRALHGGQILSAESYRTLITPGTLNDGTRLRYAGGLLVDSLHGQRVIRHGGGINGYLSELEYFPDHDLTLVALVNTAGPVSPAAITAGIAEVIFGAHPPRAVALDAPAADYVGEYRGVGRGSELTVRVVAEDAGDGILIATGRAAPRAAVHLGGGTFDRDGGRFTFIREDGRVVAVRADLGGVNTLLRRAGGGG